jgi:hypothetical protein
LSLAGTCALALKATAGASSTPRNLAAHASATGSNLQTITSNGTVADAVTAGTADISKFLIAPSGKVYLVGRFSGGTFPSGCSLAEVPAEGGELTCVDPTISISWSAPGSSSQNPAVQFDASGAIYYVGTPTGGGTAVLRRNAGGGDIRDLVTDNVSLRDFLVQPDGTVFLTGDTASTGASWLRKISPSGGLQTLFAGSRTNSTIMEWIKRFPDGNVYASQMNIGFMRYLTSSGAVDPQFWLSNYSPPGTPAPHFSVVKDCSSGCAFPEGPLRTTLNGNVYAIASGGALTQYFPVVKTVPLAGLKTTTVFQSVLDHLIVAGTNASGQNITTLYDATNGAEEQLLGPENDIEIYHVNFVYEGGVSKLLFDGLRFSDNKYVLGQVDLTTKQVSVTSTIATKWSDFQTFG